MSRKKSHLGVSISTADTAAIINKAAELAGRDEMITMGILLAATRSFSDYMGVSPKDCGKWIAGLEKMPPLTAETKTGSPSQPETA